MDSFFAGACILLLAIGFVSKVLEARKLQATVDELSGQVRQFEPSTQVLPHQASVEAPLFHVVETLSDDSALTARETDVLELLAKGRNALYVARHYGLSVHTVKSHIASIYRKLDVHSQQELIDVIERHLGADDLAERRCA